MYIAIKPVFLCYYPPCHSKDSLGLLSSNGDVCHSNENVVSQTLMVAEPRQRIYIRNSWPLTSAIQNLGFGRFSTQCAGLARAEFPTFQALASALLPHFRTYLGVNVYFWTGYQGQILFFMIKTVRHRLGNSCNPADKEALWRGSGQQKALDNPNSHYRGKLSLTDLAPWAFCLSEHWIPLQRAKFDEKGTQGRNHSTFSQLCGPGWTLCAVLRNQSRRRKCRKFQPRDLQTSPGRLHHFAFSGRANHMIGTETRSRLLCVAVAFHAK